MTRFRLAGGHQIAHYCDEQTDALVGTTARVENFEQHPLNFYALTSELTVS